MNCRIEKHNRVELAYNKVFGGKELIAHIQEFVRDSKLKLKRKMKNLLLSMTRCRQEFGF